MGADLTIAQGAVVALMCAFCGLVGFALGWTRAVAYESNRRIMKMSAPKEERRSSKRHDTEKNIGGMFANIVRELCPEDRFRIEAYHSNLNGYFIKVWPFGGGGRVFTLTVSLDHVKGSEVCGTMGLTRRFMSGLSEDQIEELRQEVLAYLKTL